MTNIKLYIGLDNFLAKDIIIPDLKEEVDYIRNDSSIFIKPGKHGIHGLYEIRKYAKILADSKKSEIILLYPEAEKLEWPCPIGRYEIGFTTFDVVFGKSFNDELRSAPGNPSWDEKQKNEYLKCSYGFWPSWTYSLENANLAYLVMKYVEMLDEKNRIPWKIARHILSVIDCSNYPDGIMYGKWDGKYNDGIHPTRWKSVGEIMNERVILKVPVKYGQCWVFSEILTAIFRFLGIPARTVYALNAHVDIGRDRGIDFIHVKEKGESHYEKIKVSDIISNLKEGTIYSEDDDSPISTKGGLLGYPDDIPLEEQKEDIHNIIQNGDRCWNFHVWCEIYCERSDLKHPYDQLDWQICDASPISEILTNDGKHYFGPCPVTSIKNGVTQKYDHSYLYSAVNSLWRQWDSFEYENTIVIYPFDINYSTFDVNSIDSKRVLLYTRDPNKSSIFTVVRESLTHSYRHTSYKHAMNAYHREFPFIVYTDNNFETVKLDIHTHPKGKYMVQVAYLNRHKLLSCHRQIYECLDEIFIPERPFKTTIMSILTINLNTKEFWPQVL